MPAVYSARHSADTHWTEREHPIAKLNAFGANLLYGRARRWQSNTAHCAASYVVKMVVEFFGAVPAAVWAALAALAAAVVAGTLALLGVWLTNRANNQRLRIQLDHDSKEKDRKQRTQQLEQLYTLLVAWRASAIGFYDVFAKVMKGNLQYDTAIQLTKEAFDKEPRVDIDQLEMLIDLHFANLRPIWDRVLGARSELSEVLHSLKRQHEGGGDSGHLLKPFVEAVVKLEKEVAALKSGIVEIARGSSSPIAYNELPAAAGS
jgi:hypothetical protein